LKKELLSGNEAIARGAYEAGAFLGFGYPGTPSTEILENFANFEGVYAEWSVNEKVALEAATGASLGGARAFATMKHVGLNVALDAYMTLAYTGINGGLVVFNADDPGMHSSQDEQDNRYIGKFSFTPVIEPSDSQEAKDFIKDAFDISEKFDLPVLFRTTTRIAHGRSVVLIDENLRPVMKKKPLSVPWDKYTMMPLNAKRKRHELLLRFEELKKFSEETALNREENGNFDIAFITSGVVYTYIKEVFPKAAVLKLGLSNPLPMDKIKKFAAKAKRLIVAEELEPFMEDQLKAEGIKCEGRNLFPREGEFSPDIIRQAITGKKPEGKCVTQDIAARPPSLCPECGHRGVFKALNELGYTVMGDIGCYTLGALPPFNALQTCIDMGSGLSHAYGAEKAGEPHEKIVAVIGDSTFMHSGITAVINQVYNGSNTFNIILDNRTTAMTGRQNHPGTGRSIKGADSHMVDIEKLLEAIGVKTIRVIDPLLKLADTKDMIEKMSREKGVKVLIARRPCALLK